MGIEINEGTARVSTSYGIKAPSPDVAYASTDTMVSFSVEFDLSDTDSDAVRKALIDFEEKLQAAVRLQAMANVGLDFEETDGYIVPKFKEGASAKKASGGGGGSRAPRRSSGGGGGGGQRRSGGGGGNPQNHPIVTIDGEQYYDQRGAKEDGRYRAGTADFKQVNGTSQLWMYQKDGTPNDDVLDLLEDSGIEFD